jgi:serine protease DegS
VIRGYLGVEEAVTLPEDQARLLGIDGSAVQITDVSGPAVEAGLRPGDILTHVNGERTFTAQQAMNLVASAQPGQTIRIRAIRPDGTSIDTSAVLEERPLRAN